MTKISFIIPTKDNPEDLKACLRSVNDSFNKKDYDVEAIIVDDRSSKADREDIITNFVKFNICGNMTVKTLFMQKNVGFIKACNAGIKCVLNEKKLPKYIGILHDDVFVLDGWLKNLESAFDDDISTWCVSSPSNSAADLHHDINVVSDIPNVDKIQMYATLFKTEAFQKYGLFNEDNLTSINIEYEFCKKLIDDGKTIKVIPTAAVSHKSRMSSEYENPNQLTWQKMQKATEYVQQIQNDFVENTKQYVVYTFVKDGESIPMYKTFENDIEYVCFTTNNAFASNEIKYAPWKIYTIDKFAAYFNVPKNSVEMKEFIKLNPHLFFNNFSLSIWVDPMYADLKDVKQLILRMNKDNFVLCGDSAKYDCSYKQIIDMKSQNLMTNEEFENVLQIYKWVKYPAHNGVADTSVMLRKHNDEKCKLAMTKIWNFVQHTYANDQLFFNFVLNSLKYNYLYIPINVMQKTFVERGEA